MAAAPRTETIASLIVCEGDTDKYFFNALIEARGLPKFRVVSADGRTKIQQAIANYKVANPKRFSELKSLAVVVDRDKDSAEAFKDAIGQLQKAFPQRVMPTKPLVQVGQAPRLSVIMIPLEGETGHIESYLSPIAQLYGGHVPGYINTLLAQVQSQKWNDEVRHNAAWLRIFMAVHCHDPFMQLGEMFGDAKTKSLIDLRSKLLKPLEAFLLELCS